MIITKELYIQYVGKRIKVTCAGGIYVGVWSEWFTAEDNDWGEDIECDGESILIDLDGGAPFEISIKDIKLIEIER